ncbi:MAG: double-strand break repair helicase AddA [Inquilinaceae bacterium]
MTASGALARPLSPDVAQRRASDPVASVWVGASAGTGKTRVLTSRVLRLMLDGVPPDRILCITFTRAAAAEMNNRIHRTLARWAIADEADLALELGDLTGVPPDAARTLRARRLFAEVLETPGGMKIQTIHAFCQSLLRRFPLEAGLAPHFSLMDDRSAAELLAEVRDRLLTESDSVLAAALAAITAEIHEDAFAELMGELMRERGRLGRIADAHGGLEPLIDAVYDRLGVARHLTDAALVDAACRDDAFDGPALRAAAEALTGGSATDRVRGAGLAAWLAATPVDRQHALSDYALLYLKKEGGVRDKLLTKSVAQKHPDVGDALAIEAERLLHLADRRRALAVAGATGALLTVGIAMIRRYAAAKAGRALLDYDDLIMRAAQLLHRPGIAPWVLFKLDGGIDHVLVDEAQDTNPEQWRVIAALTAEFFAGLGARADRDRTVFAVGDEKQSIFSFQGADPAEFVRMRDYFEGQADAAEKGWRRVALETSFRSTAAVLDAVDAVFAEPAAADGVVLDADAVIRHLAHRRGQGGLVELWPPIEPETRDTQEAWALPTRQGQGAAPAARQAAMVAATIAGWLAGGERLEARGRTLRPGDILILVRTRNAFAIEMIRALKEKGVPVAGIDRIVLTRQLAVMDLIALGQFLLLPDDDLTLATVLKGPLIGLDEDRLFDLAHGRSGSLWAALGARAAADPVCAAAGLYLRDLLARVDFVAPYELLAGALGAPCPADRISGRRAMLGRLEPEAEDPLDEFLSLALAFEADHPPSLQRFLHWIAAAEAEVKREAEHGGADRVRVMTVHGAKGLQAPVVILPDTMGTPTKVPRILWPDRADGVPLWSPRRAMEDAVFRDIRDRAVRRRDQEYRRLLYVALTRAEDRLYIGGYRGVQQPSPGCWYALCRAGLDGLAGVESVTGAGGGGLRYTVPQTVAPPVPAATEETAAVGRLPDWAGRPAPAEPAIGRPLTPSRPEGEEPPVRAPLTADDGARFLRGRLVHTLLQHLPDLDAEVRPGAAARFLARRIHGLAAEDQQAIAAETLAVLDDPRFAALCGPDSRAEVPVVGRVGDRLLSGQLDRLAVTGDSVWIVDYKTNRPPPETETGVPPVYLRQMASYRAILRDLYDDRPVRCLLLWTDGPRLMPLSDTLLDRHAP